MKSIQNKINVLWNYPLCSLTGMICYDISFFIKNSNLSLDMIMRKLSIYETEGFKHNTQVSQGCTSLIQISFCIFRSGTHITILGIWLIK